jgi:hypothetical protein
MFDSTSRYYSLDTGSHTLADGREVTYVTRRFLPRGEDLPLLSSVTFTDGDRLDLVAHRTVGSSEAFWRVCDANDAMNPRDLEEPGLGLRVPIPQANT